MRRSRWTRIKDSRAYRTLDRALSPLNWKKRQRMKQHVRARLAQAERDAQSVSYFQRELFRSLANLARPASEQIAYLQHIFRFMKMKQEDDWISAEELVLEYDDSFRGACGDPERGTLGWRHALGLTPEQIEALTRLDDKFDEIRGEESAELWTGLALKREPFWREVREMAIECLNLLEGRQWSLDPALNSNHSDAMEPARQ